MIFWFEKVYIFWKFILYYVHGDKIQNLQKFPYGKINFQKMHLFFFCDFSFILNSRFLDELKDKICVSKSWFNWSFNWTSIKRYSELQCKVTYNFAKKRSFRVYLMAWITIWKINEILDSLQRTNQLITPWASKTIFQCNDSAAFWLCLLCMIFKSTTKAKEKTPIYAFVSALKKVRSIMFLSRSSKM